MKPGFASIVRCALYAMFAVCPAVRGADEPPPPSRPTTPATAEAADTQTDAQKLEITAPPSSDAEIKALADQLAGTLEKKYPQYPSSQPSTQPASAPAEEAARVRSMAEWEVAKAVSQYRDELSRWLQVRTDIATLKSEESIRKQSAELEGWATRRKALQAVQIDDSRWDMEYLIKEADRDYQARKTDLDSLATLQSSREQQMKTLAAEKKRSEEDAANTLAQLKEHLGSLPEAKTEEDRQLWLLRKRRLEWEHSLHLLRGAMNADLVSQLSLAQQRDADRMAGLEEYVQSLRDYLTRLQNARLLYDAETARVQLANKNLPSHARTYWEIRLAVAEGMTRLRELSQRSDPGLTPAEFDKLRRWISRSQKYVADFVDSLGRRRGEMVFAAYRRLNEIVIRETRHLNALQTELDEVVDRLRDVQDCKDMILNAVMEGRDDLDQQVRQLKGSELAEARQLQAKLTADELAKLEDKLAKVTEEMSSHRDRLKAAIDGDKDNIGLKAYLDELIRARTRIYRRYLLVPSRGVLRQDWTQVRKEWQSLGGDRTDLVGKIHERTDQVLAQWASVSVGHWLAIFVGVFLVTWLAGRVRKDLNVWIERTLQRVPPTETENPDEEREYSRAIRLQVQMARLVASTAIPVWPMTLFLLALLALAGGGGAFVILPAGIALVMAAILARAALRALFDLEHGGMRVLPCADTVARYHYRWLTFIGLFALVTLSLSGLLRVTGLLREIGSTVWDISLTLTLILAFIYLSRRRMFAIPRWGEAAGRPWRQAIRARVPRLVSLVLVLLVGLEFAGYAALADYLLRGLSATTVIYLVGRSLVGLLAAWQSRGHQSPPVSSSEEQDASPPARPAYVPMLALLLRMVVVLTAVAIVLKVWGVTLVAVRDILNYPLLQSDITPLLILGAILAFGIGLVASRTIRAFLETEVFPQTTHLDRGTQATIVMLLHYTIVALSIYVALRILDVDFTALTILLGTLGLGLGLGLQPFFVNFISGLMILFERQIKVGDLVEVAGKVGEVTSISMRSTKVKSFDNVELVIPNGEFITGNVVNWTLTDQKLRGRVEVGVAYGSDVKLVRKLLLDIAHRHPNVLVDPAPAVWFTNFADSSLNFVLVCWFSNAASRWEFVTEVRYEIDEAFREHDIEIPFPQRTISLLGDKPIAVELRQQKETPPAESPDAPDEAQGE